MLVAVAGLEPASPNVIRCRSLCDNTANHLVHLLRGGSHPCLSASFAFITDAFRKLSRTLTCFHLLDIAGFHGCILYAWGGGRMISPPCYCQGQAMRETSIIFFSLSIAVWYSLSISIPSS